MQENIKEKEQLIHSFQKVRHKTLDLCHPLQNEDYVIQCAEEVSPIKWHLAHITWFFEVFILAKFLTNYKLYHKEYPKLFNSYYYSLNDPYPKQKRGFLSRPLVKEILQYHQFVNLALIDLIDKVQIENWEPLKSLVTLGIHHEQQHQELILMDIKYNFSINPCFPSYSQTQDTKGKYLDIDKIDFSYIEGGLVEIGSGDASSFSFDNELPRHQQILKPYYIANRLVTNREYLEFIEEGGYQNPKWWLSQGFETVLKNDWKAPLYWHMGDKDAKWGLFTLSGLQELNLNEPVSHLSYFEADAFANWSGCRLPKEAEWEHCVLLQNANTMDANLLETGLYHPQAVSNITNIKAEIQQLYGDLWEWTASHYGPYPGFKPLPGELSEYNGKFMSGQMVLRGGSCATPESHIRSTYRNFYQPDKRWQFSGLRLAKDA